MISPEKRRNLITMIDNSFRGSPVGITSDTENCSLLRKHTGAKHVAYCSEGLPSHFKFSPWTRMFHCFGEQKQLFEGHPRKAPGRLMCESRCSGLINSVPLVHLSGKWIVTQSHQALPAVLPEALIAFHIKLFISTSRGLRPHLGSNYKAARGTGVCHASQAVIYWFCLCLESELSPSPLPFILCVVAKGICIPQFLPMLSVWNIMGGSKESNTVSLVLNTTLIALLLRYFSPFSFISFYIKEIVIRIFSGI